MPLFECSKCHCVENTALSNYAFSHILNKNPPLCSECDPDIGKWHDSFTKTLVSDTKYVTGKLGFLEPVGGWK